MGIGPIDCFQIWFSLDLEDTGTGSTYDSVSGDVQLEFPSQTRMLLWVRWEAISFSNLRDFNFSEILVVFLS